MVKMKKSNKPNLKRLLENGFEEVRRLNSNQIIFGYGNFRVPYHPKTDEIGEAYVVGELKDVEQHQRDKCKFDIHGFYANDGNFDAEG